MEQRPNSSDDNGREREGGEEEQEQVKPIFITADPSTLLTIPEERLRELLFLLKLPEHRHEEEQLQEKRRLIQLHMERLEQIKQDYVYTGLASFANYMSPVIVPPLLPPFPPPDPKPKRRRRQRRRRQKNKK